MPKVYLSPSGQIHNVGVGNYGTEEARCRKVAELTAKILKAAGVAVDMTPRAWNSTLADSTWLNRVVTRSNAFGADAHIAIHTNAGPRGSDGTDAWHYPGSVKGAKLTKAIYSRAAKVSPGSDGGIHTSPIFYETRYAKAPVCYIELAFHTDKADAASVSGHPDLYAEAIAAGILEYLGVKAKAAEPAKSTTALVPGSLRPKLAQLMLTYALKSQGGGDPVPLDGWEGVNVLSSHWGPAKRLLAKRVSYRVRHEHPDVETSDRPTRALYDALVKGAE